MQNKKDGIALEIPQHVMMLLRSWRDMGSTEVTGFFVTERDSPLKVIDAILIEATCTGGSVDIKPEAITGMYSAQIEEKVYPDQLGIWWHTHPGGSPNPSAQDWTTFRDMCKDRNTNIMYILAKGDQEFAHIGVTDPQSSLTLEMNLAIKHPHGGWADMPDWAELQEQYEERVKKFIPPPVTYSRANAYVNPYVQTEPIARPLVGQETMFRDNDLVPDEEGCLPCPMHADDTVFGELFLKDQLSFKSLYNKVRCLEITPDEANMLALEQGLGKDFFTDIYDDRYMTEGLGLTPGGHPV